MRRLFTSESVGPGHPDKICDQISDAILDECLRRDPYSHVACECLITDNYLLIAGEITGNIGKIDYATIARDVIRNIGYTSEEYGFDADKCEVKVLIHEQSRNINEGIGDKGAGDQGLMFGFASTETKTYMPLPIYLAHELAKRCDKLRREGKFEQALPDLKTQVTVNYSNYDKPKVNTVVMSVQHKKRIKIREFKKYIKENIILPVIKENGLNENFRTIINPAGKFEIGGPKGDSGLTGRKIIVDTYGGYSSHGGGAFSGKDPTKVDRSAAYMARYAAKNLVAAGYSKKIELQVSYAIGMEKPVSISFRTFHTAKVSDKKIRDAINKFFDFSPAGIIETLYLRNPIYQKTATFGHFGRADVDFSWERLDKVDELIKFKNEN